MAEEHFQEPSPHFPHCKSAPYKIVWEILSRKVGEANKNVQGSGGAFRINNMGTHCRTQKEGGHKKNDGMTSF